METNFNFKSRPCTSREQSERLLALGLKKETADAIIPININPEKGPILVDQDFWISDDPFYQNTREKSIPAWSLHRLIILCGNIACDWIFRNDDCYTNAINCIEWLIKEGYFNKKYLEE